MSKTKKKSAGAAVQSSSRIRAAARLRLAREESRKEWLTRRRAFGDRPGVASLTRQLEPAPRIKYPCARYLRGDEVVSVEVLDLSDRISAGAGRLLV